MFTSKKWASVFALLIIASMILSACATPTPEVIEKIVTQVVKETVVQKEIVKETIIVEGTPQVVEKEITKIVEVEKVVTPTPTPLPEGGFVTSVTFADAKILNPILSSDSSSSWVHGFLFEGALDTDPWSGETIPGLTEGWTVSDDGLTYTFTVRDGIYWTDGTQVTGKDFAFTYQALMSGELDTPRLSNVELIEKIELIDDMTVAFTFTEINCVALPDLGLGWLPAHMYGDDYTDIMENDLNTNPTVTNGSFTLKEWVKDDHITLVRNENYWKGTPHLEGLIYRVVPNQTVMIQQLKTGEVDVGGVQPQYLVEMELQEHLNLYKYFDDGYTYIGFQMGDPNDPQPRLNEDGTVNEAHGIHPILSDKLVRQAIVYAIDRNAIIAKVNFGQGMPLHANVVPAVGWAYNDELEPRAYDPEKAVELLEEAGWTDTDEDGVRECHGCAYAEEGTLLALNLKTNAGNEIRENIGVIAQDQLGEVGFDIEFEAMEWNAYLGVLLGQTFDMVIIGWTGLGTDPDDDLFWKADTDIPDAGFGFVSYYNPDVEELLKTAKTLPGCDQGERGAMYRQIQEYLYDEQPYNWLYVPRATWAYNKRIGGVDPGPWTVWHNVHEWYIK